MFTSILEPDINVFFLSQSPKSGETAGTGAGPPSETPAVNLKTCLHVVDAPGGRLAMLNLSLTINGNAPSWTPVPPAIRVETLFPQDFTTKQFRVSKFLSGGRGQNSDLYS